MPQISLPPERYFWSKVNKTNTCWLWMGSITPYGHGRFRFAGETMLAHRVAWILKYGPILPTFVVAHRCTERACVRPAHLYLCTRAHNNADGNRRRRGQGRLETWRQPKRSFEETYWPSENDVACARKECITCHRSLPLSMFANYRRYSDGKMRKCRHCVSIWKKHWRKYGKRITPEITEQLLRERFWQFINICTHGDECPYCCWPWNGRRNRDGYGVVTYHKTTTIASRAIFELWHKKRIKTGICICHYCDNPICVNPAHLWPGTIADNNRDCNEKGRRVITNHVRGEQVQCSKVTPADVTMIRILKSQGFTYELLRGIFGIDNNPLFCIVHHKTWKHIELS